MSREIYRTGLFGAVVLWIMIAALALALAYL